MTLNLIENGDDADATKVMENLSVNLRATGINLISQLQDRTVTLPADGGIWGEAYSDADGRLDSVDTGSTDALFDTDKYTPDIVDEASADTTSNPDTFTNPSYAFDGNIATAATETRINIDESIYLGKTFSSKYVYKAYIKAQLNAHSNSAGPSSVYLQTYDGTTWTNHTLLGINSNYTTQINVDKYVTINDTVQGIRVAFNLHNINGGTNETNYLYALEYGLSKESIITHDIPTGTFSATMSSMFATFKPEDWEAGADVQYKLTGTAGAEDTGWLDINEISTFTAFEAEPDILVVKMTPKATSPVPGVPSIKGFSLKEIN